MTTVIYLIVLVGIITVEEELFTVLLVHDFFAIIKLLSWCQERCRLTRKAKIDLNSQQLN